MIKAIIFDWGGVLIEDPARGLMEFCSNYLGVDAQALKNVFSLYSLDFQKGVITEEKLWEKVCLELKIAVPSAKSLWKDAARHVFKEREEIFDLVITLKEKGYKTGFLSNTEFPARECFYERGYGQYFDTAVFSCQEMMAKPEREIYALILKRMQAEPHEAIFIDDKLEFVKGAEIAGIKGILFENSSQLIKKLAEFLAR